MNFGQNLYTWFLSNAQSLVLMAIVVIGVYLGFKREFSKLIGFLVVALIAVGLVFQCVWRKRCAVAVVQ
jgi:multisubunit Na+/H+ antiporter MnhC subunit